MINLFFNYNDIVFYFKKWIYQNIYSLLINLKFIQNYYYLNDLLWQEGLLIDFLQKKILNNLILKFLINSAYLFNERFLFDKLIKFYLNLIIWPAQTLFIFELSNISNLFFITIFLFIFFFFSCFLIFLFL